MRRYILVPVILFFVISVTAQQINQEVIAAAGGYDVKGNISISWTLGETIVSTFSSNSLVLTHGFQQKLIITTVQDNLDPGLKVSLFPNPTDDILNIHFDPPTDREVDLLLTDMQGRTLKTYKIGTAVPDKQINLQDIPAGIYFVKLIKGKLINIYRVVKL
jgi:hypothetical protein